VELGVEADEFQDTNTIATTEPAATDSSVAVVEESAPPVVTESAAPVVTEAAAPAPRAAAPREEAPQAPKVTTYAQLLSTSDQKTAENLAARVIDRGFNTAYVERSSTEKGPIFRVRVKFDSEAEARAAESKLKEFSKEVWITK
jgi:cell division septation protein DedD